MGEERPLVDIGLRGLKVTKYRKSAKGQPCQVRIPGVCNFDDSTTVLAHLNGGGMGLKRNDIHGAFCCSSCHDVLDGRATLPKSLYVKRAEDLLRDIKLMHLEGVIRTQEIMIKAGILKL